MSRLYGETISEDVVKQLNLRASILGEQGLRNSNHLRYLNQKTAWIRVISSVNRFEKEEAAFTNKSAKNFILSGGELKWDGSKFIPRTGFNPTIAEVRGRYNYDSNLGIRPEAGITSFTVTHKNTFGTLREANIGFNVWTRNDLNLVQDLFLRPGISVVIEWGNSIYLDDTGNVKDSLNIPSYNEYFNNNTSVKIASILKENKENNYYNYDGFLGLVTNFSWSFRSDGGYDCTLKVITKGAVLESLSVMKSKAAVELELKENFQLDYFQTGIGSYYDNSLEGQGSAAIATKEGDLYASKTFLHYFASSLEKGLESQLNKGYNPNPANPLSYDDFTVKVYNSLEVTNQVRSDFEERPAPFIEPLKNELGTEATSNKSLTGPVIQGYDRNFLVTGFEAQGEDDENKTFYQYISLRTFLALLNISFSFKTPDGNSLTSFYVGKVDEDSVDSIFTDPKYKTFTNHFSLNPLYCLIPNRPTQKEFLDENDSPLVQITKGNVHDHIRLSKPPYDSIFNIFVNIGAVIQDLDSILEGQKEPKDANLFDFVKNVLSKINSYLGGINELDLHFDEDLQKWIVIDRSLIVEEIRKNENNIEQLDVTGLKSTVSSISLQTKITTNLASQIAISAQGTKAYDVNSSLPLFDWNANIKDRYFLDNPSTDETEEEILKELDQLEKEKKEQEKKLFEEFYNSVLTAYKEINSSGVQTKQIGFLGIRTHYEKFDKEVFEKVKSTGMIVFKNKVYGKTYKNEKAPTDGLIPIELSLTLDGISGLKIGQVFRIGSLEKPSSILPDIYDKYGFIITGLSNKIENNKWFTEITGLTFKFEVDADSNIE